MLLAWKKKLKDLRKRKMKKSTTTRELKTVMMRTVTIIQKTLTT